MTEQQKACVENYQKQIDVIVDKFREMSHDELLREIAELHFNLLFQAGVITSIANDVKLLKEGNRQEVKNESVYPVINTPAEA
ncbi:hypothetical protein CJD36_008230 [Flavipsychrobacter stenotrophus]|uniref:Uncharacterized protein n=1 Tax=Flavipsychrobacter stenotrophus TaxID=2077091 RepID=A0A2S7SXY2_9BACT|nr:hypothetical protein [Flavipsychrobacter stenotrophus]PQJ11772.1 hypothetical protein CJD36_008230 [Flavipsychrobacter stenotrophus]